MKSFISKHWWVLFIAVMVGVAVYLTAAGTLTAPKYQSSSFGKNHPIPDGLEYDIPKTESDSAAPNVESLQETDYLQLWNGLQGGIYKYSFYYPALPDGEVYLRCFEVTENIELSASRLKEASTALVINHKEFGPIVERQQFVIYEGDWDDYYAARIEVWFKDGSTKEETKLMEKIYQVEGWMR